MGAWSTDIDIEQGATFRLGFRYCDPIIGPDADDDSPEADAIRAAYPDLQPGEVAMQGGKPVPGEPKNLVGCTARMQIKKALKDATAAVTATSEPYPEDPDADPELTARADRITLESLDDADQPIKGRIDVTLTDTDTDVIDFVKGVYDLELVYPKQAGELRPFTERVLEGAVNTTLNVTKVETPIAEPG